jgi:hypothetical protein
VGEDKIKLIGPEVQNSNCTHSHSLFIELQNLPQKGATIIVKY